jgi:hypothetical protein
LSKVGLGMTRSGKTRKGGTQRRKDRQDYVRPGAEQGQAWNDYVRKYSQECNLV